MNQQILWFSSFLQLRNVNNYSVINTEKIKQHPQKVYKITDISTDILQNKKGCTYET